MRGIDSEERLCYIVKKEGEAAMQEMYIRYQELDEFMRLYHEKHHLFINFNDAINHLIEQGSYTRDRIKQIKRTNLSEEEFIEVIGNSQIGTNQYLHQKKESDSQLIPYDLNLFAFKHLKQKEQIFHPHNCFDFNFLYKGEAVLYFENTERRLQEGEICLMAPHSNYRIELVEESTILIELYIKNSTFDRLFFDLFIDYDIISKFIRNILYDQYSPNYLLFRSEEVGDLKEIIQNIFIETNYVDQYSGDAAIYWTHLLFIMLLRNFKFEFSYVGLEKDKNEYFFEILTYVYENYRYITMKKLANHFHYNESYLSTLFMQKLHMKFIDVLTDIRMNKAVDLLKNSDWTIYDIAQQVGYESSDHFTRVFKKTKGCTPGIYRNKKAS